MKIILFRVLCWLSAFGMVSCSGTSPVPAISSSTKVKDMPVPYDNPGIFKSYDARFNNPMNDTWTRKFDASGISFNSARTCTLVTKQHVVMARHFKRRVGRAVIFHDRYGKRLERKLVKILDVLGDCSVGLLDKPVSDGYKAYPLLAPEEGLREKLLGEFVILTDQNKRLFVHEVAGFLGSKIYFRFDAEKGIGYGKMLVKGDSGNPSFIMVGGEPVLIETHHTGGPGAGPFYGDAVLIEKLKKQIAALGGTGDNAGSVRLVKFR